MVLHIGDTAEMKKPHPCGERRFCITRVGMDIKLRCCGCGHQVMLPRSQAEKRIKRLWPLPEGALPPENAWEHIAPQAHMGRPGAGGKKGGDSP